MEQRQQKFEKFEKKQQEILRKRAEQKSMKIKEAADHQIVLTNSKQFDRNVSAGTTPNAAKSGSTVIKDTAMVLPMISNID